MASRVFSTNSLKKSVSENVAQKAFLNYIVEFVQPNSKSRALNNLFYLRRSLVEALAKLEEWRKRKRRRCIYKTWENLGHLADRGIWEPADVTLSK